MQNLRVIEPGMFTTVQDLGRMGHSAIGVPPSGAADALSLTIGNRLLGNPDRAAALECTLLGPSVTVDRDVWVCLTGADCSTANIAGVDDERSLPCCEPVLARAGEQIKIGSTTKGARAYLCLSGGIDVPLVLGSRSTLVGACLGGHAGRPLRTNDMVPLTDLMNEPLPPLGELRRWLGSHVHRRTLRVVPSLHTDRFPSGALESLASIRYTVGAQSNRVGIRLDGDAIPLPDDAGSLESEPTVTGGIQIAGNGRPIILGVDRPTTGGYPLLACVIEADRPAVAMLRPRDSVRFEIISINAARQLWAEQRRSLDRLVPACEDGPHA